MTLTSHLQSPSRLVPPLLLLCAILSPSASASSPPPAVASPAATTELICHTDNPAECYPKVFSATEEFQVVRDDQDLPPGLHVRLDVQTGQKQAKLYNPDEEENPALAGLPVSHDVIVVDPESALQDGDESQIPVGAPAYEPAGVVKAPREKNEGFTTALQTIKTSLEKKSDSNSLNEALELLDDLSHDIYYGLQIAADPEVLQSLFCLLLSPSNGNGRVSLLASSVLSASLANNARALAALEKSWDDIAARHCTVEVTAGSPASTDTIRHALFSGLVSASSETGTGEQGSADEAERVRPRLTAISGLLKSPRIRTEFLEHDGMRSFLRILLRDGAAWEARRAKVAQITSDTFLDEDFGATLGVWPGKIQQASDGACDIGAGGSLSSSSLSDECWEYHLEKISRGPEAPEWSEQLLALLRQAQTPKSRPGHQEL